MTEEEELDALLEKPFKGVGNLGSALKEFEKMYYTGTTKHWPKYWSTFADQAAADLVALRVELLVLKELEDRSGEKHKD